MTEEAATYRRRLIRRISAAMAQASEYQALAKQEKEPIIKTAYLTAANDHLDDADELINECNLLDAIFKE